MLTIAILDDHELFRKSIQSLLESTGEYKVLIEASDSHEFNEQLSTCEKLPDVYLLEPRALGIHGYTEIKKIQNSSAGTKVIVFSIAEFDQLDHFWSEHVDGFISKSCKCHVFLPAIKKIIAGERIIVMEDEDKVLFLDDTYRTHKPLSVKQQAFLKLCACPDLSYKMIADKLNLSPKTIDRHRELLFKKLNVTSRTGLAMYAIQNGLTKK